MLVNVVVIVHYFQWCLLPPPPKGQQNSSLKMIVMNTDFPRKFMVNVGFVQLQFPANLVETSRNFNRFPVEITGSCCHNYR